MLAENIRQRREAARGKSLKIIPYTFLRKKSNKKGNIDRDTHPPRHTRPTVTYSDNLPNTQTRRLHLEKKRICRNIFKTNGVHNGIATFQLSGVGKHPLFVMMKEVTYNFIPYLISNHLLQG